MVQDLCKISLKVFHRALGLPLFSAMTEEWCLLLDCSRQWKTVAIDSSSICTLVDCRIVTVPYSLILPLKMLC